MKRVSTHYEQFEASSAENRRLLREEEFILEVTEVLSAMLSSEKVSKTELARRLGKTKGFVTQILSGNRNLTLRTIADVADALGYGIELRANKRGQTLEIHDSTGETVAQVCEIAEWKRQKENRFPHLSVLSNGCIGSGPPGKQDCMTKPSVDLSRLIGAVELQRVRLVETTGKTAIRSPGEVGQETVCVIHTTARVGDSAPKGNSFLVIATIRVEVSGKDGGKEPAVSVKASFELEYSLPKGFAPKPTELQGFAEINGIFNAWPYWREYVQSMFIRMGLPPLTLPVYRLKDRALTPAPQGNLPPSEAPKRKKSRKSPSTARA